MEFIKSVIAGSIDHYVNFKAKVYDWLNLSSPTTVKMVAIINLSLLLYTFYIATLFILFMKYQIYGIGVYS